MSEAFAAQMRELSFEGSLIPKKAAIAAAFFLSFISRAHPEIPRCRR